MKRPAIRIYLTPTLLRLIQDEAYLAGLKPAQYVKFVLLKEINSEEAKTTRERLLEKVVDE